MFRQFLASAALVIVAAVLLVAAWPGLFSLQRAPIIAQVVSLRGAAVTATLVIVVLLLLLLLVNRSFRRFGSALALLVAFAMQLWRRARGTTRFTARSAIAGLLLGLANFGNILFYLRGHRALPQHPALVFASMNIGVVALGALVGLLLFRERLSRLNLAGVALAAVAIGVLARG